jgi:hypothetical protein
MSKRLARDKSQEDEIEKKRSITGILFSTERRSRILHRSAHQFIVHRKWFLKYCKLKLIDDGSSIEINSR